MTAASAHARCSDSRRSSDGSAPRPITTGKPSSRARPTFSPASRSSTATMPIPQRRSSRHSRRPDLAEADDHDVVAPRHGAAAEQPGQPAVDEPVHQPGGERRLEDERGQHRDGEEGLQALGPVGDLVVGVDGDQRLGGAVGGVDHALARARPCRRSSPAAGSRPARARPTAAARRSCRRARRRPPPAPRHAAGPAPRSRTSSTRVDSRRPTGGSRSSRTAIRSSPRHGPASDGRDDVGHRGDLAVLEVAIDLPGHRRVEDRHQHRDVGVDVADHQGDAQHDRVVARDDHDAVDAVAFERVADLALLGRLHPVDLGARRVERLARLLGEVALPDQQDGRHSAPTYPACGYETPDRSARPCCCSPAAAAEAPSAVVPADATMYVGLRRERGRAADRRDVARGRRLRARREPWLGERAAYFAAHARRRTASCSTPRTRRPPRRSAARSRRRSAARLGGDRRPARARELARAAARRERGGRRGLAGRLDEARRGRRGRRRPAGHPDRRRRSARVRPRPSSCSTMMPTELPLPDEALPATAH